MTTWPAIFNLPLIGITPRRMQRLHPWKKGVHLFSRLLSWSLIQRFFALFDVVAHFLLR